MSVRMSRAFAAMRQALVMRLTDELQTKLIPSFNAEVEDIRRQHDEEKPRSEALADHTKRSRILDLHVKKQQFIDSLNSTLKMECKETIDDYKGEVVEVEVDGKKHQEAQFPDGSKARVPNSLWIDFSQFQRV